MVEPNSPATNVEAEGAVPDAVAPRGSHQRYEEDIDDAGLITCNTTAFRVRNATSTGLVDTGPAKKRLRVLAPGLKANDMDSRNSAGESAFQHRWRR